jgi:hypothetical protein
MEYEVHTYILNWLKRGYLIDLRLQGLQGP